MTGSMLVISFNPQKTYIYSNLTSETKKLKLNELEQIIFQIFLRYNTLSLRN